MFEIEEPELDFTCETLEFYGVDDGNFFKRPIFEPDDKQIICRVQGLDDLKKLKGMFNHLIQLKDNCMSPVGSRCPNQKIEIQKDYAMRNFSKYIQENIIEFKDMGFDLSVEWVE